MLAVPLAGRDLTKGAYLLVLARESRQACAVFFVGPSGVGKSTILDAICFCLFNTFVIGYEPSEETALPTEPQPVIFPYVCI